MPAQFVSPRRALAELEQLQEQRALAYKMPKDTARERRDRCRSIQATWISEKVLWSVVRPSADEVTDLSRLFIFGAASAAEFASERAQAWGDRADRHAADMAGGL